MMEKVEDITAVRNSLEEVMVRMIEWPTGSGSLETPLRFACEVREAGEPKDKLSLGSSIFTGGPMKV